MGKNIKRPLSQAKAQLNELIKLVELEGVEVILLKHGRECARIIPVKPTESPPKLFGFGQSFISYQKGDSLELGDDAWKDLTVDGKKNPLK